jgi:hypothetical protein
MLSLHQAKIIALDPNAKEEHEARKFIETMIDRSLVTLFEESQLEMVLALPKRHLNKMRAGTLDVIVTLYGALGWTLRVLEDSSELVSWLLIRRPVEAIEAKPKPQPTKIHA